MPGPRHAFAAVLLAVLACASAAPAAAQFDDGRVEVDRSGHWSSGFITPALQQLSHGGKSVFANQAMFPVVSAVERAEDITMLHAANSIAAFEAASFRTDGAIA